MSKKRSIRNSVKWKRTHVSIKDAGLRIHRNHAQIPRATTPEEFIALVREDLITKKGLSEKQVKELLGNQQLKRIEVDEDGRVVGEVIFQLDEDGSCIK